MPIYVEKNMRCAHFAEIREKCVNKHAATTACSHKTDMTISHAGRYYSI